MAKNEMNDQLIARREKMDEMRENGIEPFGVRKFDRQDLARTLNEKYSNEDKDELNKREELMNSGNFKSGDYEGY